MADFKNLKKALGPFGFMADVLSVAQTNWGAVLSLAVALGAGFWKGATDLASNPQVRVGASVFLWSIWTYIALSLLYRISRGIKVVSVIDYAHSLVVEGMYLAVNLDAKGVATAFQVGVNLRNVGNGPCKIEVHEYRIVMGGRTLPDSPVLSLICPRMGAKSVVSGSFSKDAITKDKAEGTLSLVLHYGPPDGLAVRVYRMKANITLSITAKQQALANQIAFEEDTSI